MSEVCVNNALKKWKDWPEIVGYLTRLTEQEAEIERLQDNLNQAIEALENISNMDYDASQGHTHMMYDAQMHARKTLQSIKGGESNDPQTSS